MNDFVEHKLLQGQGAGKWLPFARTKVAALHARAKAQRVTALTQRWTVEGGDVEVVVRVVGDQRYIHIRREQCPAFVSGLTDAIKNPLSAVPPLVPGAPLIDIQDPAPPDEPLLAFQRFYPSVRDAAAIDELRAFRNEPRLARDLLAAQQLMGAKSGQYSGEMRKVVQVLQGLNEVVSYNSIVALTHGVFVSANGTRWVIEISNKGVVAWIMNVCTAQPVTAENGDVLLPYTPLLSPKPTTEEQPAAIAAGTFKILADAATVLDFYTKSPFFTGCGWAFNTTGHEAANVCRTFIGPTAQSSLYKITIAEGEDAPTATTMQLLDQGFLSGTKDVHVKYPNPDGTLYSFDTTGGTGVVSNAPVYCWYDGDSLVVARHEYTPATNQQVVNDGNPGFGPCDSDFGRELRQGTFTHTNLPSLSIGNFSTPSQTTSYSGSIRRYDLAGVIGGTMLTSNPPFGTHRDVFDASIFSRSSAVDAEFVHATLIIPAHDREAAYIAVRVRRNTASGSVSHSEFFASTDETKLSECVELCPVNPLKCIQFIASSGGQLVPTSPCSDGSGVRYGLTSGSTFYPGGSTGSAINTSVQEGADCVPIEQPSFTKPDAVIDTPEPSSAVDYTFNFIASGGVSRSMPIPPSADYLVSFIDEGETQRAVAIRDAFAPDRYAISPSVVPEMLLFVTHNEGGYPLQDTFGNIAWIGVP